MTEPREPGLYPDPEGSENERWWDGENWGELKSPTSNTNSGTLDKNALPKIKWPERSLVFKSDDKKVSSEEKPAAEVEKPAIEVSEKASFQTFPKSAANPKKSWLNKVRKNPGQKQIASIIIIVTLLIAIISIMTLAFVVGSDNENDKPQLPGREKGLPQNTPAKAIAPPENMKQIRVEYPDYVKNNFIASCELGVKSKKAVCECVFSTLEKTISFEDFIKFDSITTRSKATRGLKNNQSVKQLKTITNDCVLTYYNTKS